MKVLILMMAFLICGSAYSSRVCDDYGNCFHRINGLHDNEKHKTGALRWKVMSDYYTQPHKAHKTQYRWDFSSSVGNSTHYRFFRTCTKSEFYTACKVYD